MTVSKLILFSQGNDSDINLAKQLRSQGYEVNDRLSGESKPVLICNNIPYRGISSIHAYFLAGQE